MEVFVGVGADYASATFKRLGYLSLDSNQRSNFQARELKSVYINAHGNFVKLLISRCHTNYSNIYCQVGIVALNVLGQPCAEHQDADATHAQHAPAMTARPHDTQLRVPAHQQHTKLTPQQSIQQAIARGSGDLAIDLSFDPSTADRLRTLANAKAKAVKEEDYALAKQIKVAETELRELGLKLAELDAAKNEAVRVEDYDQAKLLKDEVESLRKQIDNKFKEINIPGLNLEERAIGGRHGDEPRGRRDRSPPPVRAPAKEAARSPSPPLSSQAALSQSMRAEMLDERPISGVKMQQDEDDIPDRFKDRVDSARSRPRSRPSIARDDQPIAREEQPIAPKYTAQEKERFPPGAHPLEGVPNLEELDNPEPLGAAQSKESSELAPLIHLFGEYRARCFLSKVNRPAQCYH
jgi:centrosomal protein CEP104